MDCGLRLNFDGMVKMKCCEFLEMECVNDVDMVGFDLWYGICFVFIV